MIRRIIILCLLCLANGVHAQEVPAWTLTTADFTEQTLIPISMDNQTLTVRSRPDDPPRTIPLDQFLQIQRNQQPPGRPAGPFVLYLHSGDRLSGEAGQTRHDHLIWRNSVVGELSFPLGQIAMICRADQPEVSPADAGPEDVVHLANGDLLRGIIISINAGQLTLQPAGGDAATLSMDSVTRITFAATPPLSPHAPQTPDAPAFRLRFSDESSLVVPAVQLAGGRVQIKLSDGTTRDIPLNLIIAIEHLNGPVVWLSSLTPRENIQIPFLSMAHPARPDHNVLGAPIRFGSRTYTHGIGVHSYSRLSYALGGGFAAFRTRYAMDTTETDGRYADVTVRIRLDGRVVFQQEHFKAGVLAPAVLVPLEGASTLTLEVDYGLNMDVQDRFNWIEPALLRHPPLVSQPALTVHSPQP